MVIQDKRKVKLCNQCKMNVFSHERKIESDG